MQKLYDYQISSLLHSKVMSSAWKINKIAMSLLQLRSNSGIGTIMHGLSCNNLKEFLFLKQNHLLLGDGGGDS